MKYKLNTKKILKKILEDFEPKATHKIITNMKKILFAMMAAVALLVGITACSKDDNPSSDDITVKEQELVGLWWDEYEYAGETEAGVPFSRVLLAVQVDADHTGCIYAGVFNDKSDDPLAVYGGPQDAGFTWRLLADGKLQLGDPVTGETYALARSVTRALTRSGDSSYGDGMTDVSTTKLTYTKGSVTATNDNYSGTLVKADAGKAAEIDEKLQSLITAVNNGDAGIGYDGYGTSPARARKR